MPELPEVETTVRDLSLVLPGKTIRGITFADWPKMIQTFTPEELDRELAGETVLAVRRRAKYVLIELGSGKFLVFHRKMTGNLFHRAPDAEPDKYLRLTLTFTDGAELRFTDLRKFGRVYLFADRAAMELHMAALGPEPLEDTFTPEIFIKLLEGRKGALKPLLLNQSLLVGLGNIYVNEALWESKLHPQRAAETLSSEEKVALYHAIRHVLQLGVDNRGTTLSDYLDGEGKKGRNQDILKVHERSEKPCYTCGSIIVKVNVGQRGTYFCPICQPVPEGIVLNYPLNSRRKNNHPTP